MSDESEWKLEFDASEARRAAAAASDFDKLANSLEHVAGAAKRVPSKTNVPGVGSGANTWAGVDRMNRSMLKTPTLSKSFASAMQTFGVSGSTLRRFTIDASKAETALGRLFSITKKRTGSNLKATAATMGAMWQRMGQPEGEGFGSGLRQRASAAILAGAGTAVSATVAAIAAAAVPIGMLSYSMTTATIKAESLKLALDNVTQGAGSNWWRQSEEYARRFGGDVNTIAENLMQMKASQFSDEMTKDLFLRTQDMKALGATDEALGRMLLAIRQIKAAGRLQGDELNQLGEAGLDASFVYDVLSKKLGKSTAEVIKLKEAGQLTSDIVLPAISEAIGVKTGGKPAGTVGETAARSTVAGAWSRLQGAFSVASVEGLGTESLKPLRDGVNNFTDWLSGEGGQKAIGSFGSMLGKMFEYAPAVVDKVIWLLDEALPAAWESFTSAFASNEANTAVWSVVGDFFRDLNGEDGQGAVAMLSKFAAQAGHLAGVLSTLAGGIALVVEGGIALADGLYDAFEAISLPEIIGGVLAFSAGPLVGSAFVLGDLLVRGIADGIASSASAVWDSLVGVVGSAMGAAGRMLASMPVIGGLFEGLGGAASEGMSQGIDRGSGDVYSSAYNMGDNAQYGVIDSTQTHSPSRAMAELGMYAGEGYSLGMDQSAPWAAESGAGLGSAALVAAAAANTNASPAIASGGGVVLNVTNNFTLGAGASPEQAKQAATAVSKSIDEELSSVYRRLNYSRA